MRTLVAALLTGTAAEVTPVASIDAHRFTPGDITRTLMDDYVKATGQSATASASAA